MIFIKLVSNVLIIADTFLFASACYAKFDAQIPTRFNLDALQHLPTNYSIDPNIPNNFTLTARIPTKYSVNPNIPNNFTINANVPNNFSIDPHLPNNFTFSINLPSNFSLDPNLPSDFTINGVIPTNFSLDTHIPNNFTIDLNVPSDFSITIEIPESINSVTKCLGYVVAAYIAILAANLLLKFLKDFVKSIVELFSLLLGIYKRCFLRKTGFKTGNLTHVSSKNLHSPIPMMRSPSRESLCKDFDNSYP